MNEFAFQTPPDVAAYMASKIPPGTRTILEPTAGVGNLIHKLGSYEITAPANFFEMPAARFDCVIMNPPFSTKHAFGVPDHFQKKGMRLGYHILSACMNMSDHVIALMPWFTLVDSDVRMRSIKSYGLKSLTALPRKTFQYARIQTVVLELEKGYSGETVFAVYDLIKSSQITAAV